MFDPLYASVMFTQTVGRKRGETGQHQMGCVKGASECLVTTSWRSGGVKSPIMDARPGDIELFFQGFSVEK